MKTLRIVCRNSRLSLVQATLAKQYFEHAEPSLQVDIITKETTGDIIRDKPLYELEGRNFFSKEIDDYLLSGNADFAIHSMKDLNAERIEDLRFCGAVLERNDPRDIVIFNATILEKIRNKQTITIGTSSLRRQHQAIPFLKRALPAFDASVPTLRAKTIRGNVDSRLRQLKNNDFDGIIIASAGLNRLLNSTENSDLIQSYLADTKHFFLPLVECAPAPAQGALLAECVVTNIAAVEILKKVNNIKLANELAQERNAVRAYGGGCHQEYGAILISTKHGSVINIAGIDTAGNDVSTMQFDLQVDLAHKTLFSATDFMADFFSYKPVNEVFAINTDAVFVSHERAVNEALISIIATKNVWAAGTRTWFKLAEKGIWCNGCADGFGFRFLAPVFQSDFVKTEIEKVWILTNLQSARHWQAEGLNALGTYQLVPKLSTEIIDRLSKAQAFFWTSFQQYETCLPYVLKQDAIHLCPSGKTADLLLAQGLKPFIFPSIKAFTIWRNKNIL